MAVFRAEGLQCELDRWGRDADLVFGLVCWYVLVVIPLFDLGDGNRADVEAIGLGGAG